MVRFELDGDEAAPIHLAWDAAGRARIADRPASPVPTFSATEEHWKAFMSGRFPATRGVMTGRIRFRGRLRAIAPYSLAFNELARVGGSLPARGWTAPIR